MPKNPGHASMFHYMDNELGYAQCVISEDKKPDFESLGFVDNVSKLVKPKPAIKRRAKNVSDNEE